MTNPPLKPCPLCGGQAEDHDNSEIVYCENSACDIHVYPFTMSVWEALPRLADAALPTYRKNND